MTLSPSNRLPSNNNVTQSHSNQHNVSVRLSPSVFQNVRLSPRNDDFGRSVQSEQHAGCRLRMETELPRNTQYVPTSPRNRNSDKHMSGYAMDSECHRPDSVYRENKVHATDPVKHEDMMGNGNEDRANENGLKSRKEDETIEMCDSATRLSDIHQRKNSVINIRTRVSLEEPDDNDCILEKSETKKEGDHFCSRLPKVSSPRTSEFSEPAESGLKMRMFDFASRNQVNVSFHEYMKQSVMAKMFGYHYGGRLRSDSFDDLMQDRSRNAHERTRLNFKAEQMNKASDEEEEALDFRVTKDRRCDDDHEQAKPSSGFRVPPSHTISSDSTYSTEQTSSATEQNSSEYDGLDNADQGSSSRDVQMEEPEKHGHKRTSVEQMSPSDSKRIVRDFLMSGSMVMFPRTEIKSEPSDDFGEMSEEHWSRMGEGGTWSKSRLLRQTEIPSCPLQLKFTCKVCGEVFKNRQFRDLHVKLHESSHQFNCTVCGTGFNNADELDSHQKLHTDAHLVCEDCGYRCVREFRMRAHREICGKPTKVFKCPFCSKPFAAKRYMNIHIKSHDESNINQCPYCPNVYPLKNSLLKHVKKKHGVNRLNAGFGFDGDSHGYHFT